jgi:hypothetical protein
MFILPLSVLNKPRRPADCWGDRLGGTTPVGDV